MIEGGDELLNSELCPHCGDVIYLDQKIEWIDKEVISNVYTGGSTRLI